MGDDVLKRLLAEVAVCPGRGSSGHGLQHCAECCFGTGIVASDAHEERVMLLARDAADEIKQLRAKAARADELQALIDAFVAVDQNPDDTGWDDAYNALLAAATKEDDRD